MDGLRRKSLAALLKQAGQDELRRTLSASHLVALGIGAMIGAGLFVRTAAASAEAAGPGVLLSFLLAAVACILTALCYAEFATAIPVVGSAYTYAYANLGELAAWNIGWILMLEYTSAEATVAVAWSQYLDKLLPGALPYRWRHSLAETSATGGAHGWINIPALLILLFLTVVMVKGIRESAFVNGIIVVLKVGIVIAFIAIGLRFIHTANYTPFLIPATEPGHQGFFQHGWGGVLRGAGIVFFAFIGFDTVSMAAQEARNPARDMPIGILGSLSICTVLYVLFAWVLTGAGNWREFKIGGREAPIAYVIQHHMPGFEWMATLISVAILAGLTSVVLVMLMVHSRLLYAMANDGLLPEFFSELHNKFRTPWKASIVVFALAGAFAAFGPESLAGGLTSIGILFAFTLVSIGVIIMRREEPNAVRPFRTPLVPVVPVLAAGVCMLLIGSLDRLTQLTALGWLAIGAVVYFRYGRRHSKLNTPEQLTVAAK